MSLQLVHKQESSVAASRAVGAKRVALVLVKGNRPGKKESFPFGMTEAEYRSLTARSNQFYREMMAELQEKRAV